MALGAAKGCDTCADKRKNGDEQGVDCGGSCEQTCAPTQAPTTRAPTQLPTQAPTTSCADKIKNGDETFADCGGSCGECNIVDIKTARGVTLYKLKAMRMDGCSGVNCGSNANTLRYKAACNKVGLRPVGCARGIGSDEDDARDAYGGYALPASFDCNPSVQVSVATGWSAQIATLCCQRGRNNMYTENGDFSRPVSPVCA